MLGSQDTTSRAVMTTVSPRIGHRLIRVFLRRSEAPAITFLIVLSILLSVMTQGFLTIANLRGILEQVVVVSIVALAVNQVILSGEIDVSTGSLVAVCAFVYGNTALFLGGSWLPLLAALLVGSIVGLANGIVSTYGKVPSFVMTLGALFILRGIVLVFAGAEVINLTPSSRVFGLGSVFGIPVAIVVLAALVLIIDCVSRHTSFGRNVYAIGGNPRAARMIGLPVNKVRMLTFALTGASCGIAAAVMAGQIGQLQATAATGLELRVIAAVVLGGTSIVGGRGSTFAPLIGAALVGVILNAMTLNRVPGTFELLVLGSVILLGVSADGVRGRLLKGRNER